MKNSLIFLSLLFACLVSVAQIVNGDERTDEYLPLLYGKKVGLVCNHTSVVGNEHLINLLLRNGVDLVKVFTPEHGLSGIAQAGERVNDSIINVNQKELKIISLYGNHKKPYRSEISDCDVLLFDLQDVGCRFYTYISTLEYVMSSCAENNKSLILLDRPNPNNYIDGPVLEDKFKSFVGMQTIPVCYGLTIGEYATMINDENWLEGNNKCDLTVIKMLNYERNSKVILPIAPSPNLRTEQAIRNYPTLCFFEGTSISVGRGTSLPFEQIGFEDKKTKKMIWFPVKVDKDGIDLEILTAMYEKYNGDKKFFNNFFDKLAGNSILRTQLLQHKSSEEIRLSWKKDLENYDKIRQKYIFY